MSLRNIVIFLLIANLGYLAFSQGWLKAIVGSDNSQREPERVSRQVNPGAIAVSPVTAPSPAITPETLTPTPLATVQVAIEPEPACASKREQWVVYMGPYANKTLSDKKKAELAALGLESTSVSKPTLKVGLSLGEFDSEASAKQALSDLSTKGVKTATIVLWGTTNCP